MYKLNEEKMFYDMADGQAIVINFTTGMYYGTSSLGSAVLDSLLSGAAADRRTLLSPRKLTRIPGNSPRKPSKKPDVPLTAT